MQKIWMCWFQGIDDILMPSLNRKCIDLWKDFNPDYEIIVLDDRSIPNYLPEWEKMQPIKFNRRRAIQSDLLRLMLLSKYGGFWCDASLVPMAPLKIICSKVLNKTNIFMYRFKPRKSAGGIQHCGFRETTSWFIASPTAHHPVIDNWLEDFQKIYKNAPNILNKAVHQSLCDIFDRNVEIQNYINSMVQVDEKLPHSPIYKKQNLIPKILDSLMYKRPPKGFEAKILEDAVQSLNEYKKSI
jgi:hypothetical protein